MQDIVDDETFFQVLVHLPCIKAYTDSIRQYLDGLHVENIVLKCISTCQSASALSLIKAYI